MFGCFPGHVECLSKPLKNGRTHLKMMKPDIKIDRMKYSHLKIFIIHSCGPILYLLTI